MKIKNIISIWNERVDITTDSTDREAIKDSLEDLQFEYTYNIKLIKQFKEKVNS